MSSVISPVAEMSLEEPHDDVVAVSRLGHVGVVEEAMKQPVPDVQLGLDSALDELAVGIHRSAHLETARGGDDEPGRELAEDLRRVDRSDERVFWIGAGEIAQPRSWEPCKSALDRLCLGWPADSAASESLG